MNPERIHQILLAPVISEKSTTAADDQTRNPQGRRNPI